jgi:hypothetical protein
MKTSYDLNIAGEIITFLFDGENVYDNLFPDEKIVRVKAKCGHIITHDTLVQIMKDKLEKKGELCQH